MKSIRLALVLGMALTANAALAQDTEITIGMQLEPPHLDPTGAAAQAIDEVTYANVFEGLTRFASDGSILPGLAESWVVAPDGLSWEFKLRDGVTFHDGTPFTAEDVKFSFERAVAEDSTNAQKQLFSGINAVNVIDDLSVEIGLDQPKGSLLFNLAWGDAVIVSPATIEGINSNPVGTGPFKFSQWVQGDRVELVRNPDYWGEAPKLEKVTFKFISDPTAAFAAVMAEDIDYFPLFPAPENLAQLEADPRFTVLVGTTEGETILSTNNTREPFDDIKVRQAIAHAIDRKAIIDGAMFGYGTPIGSHFAPHHPAYVDLTAGSSYDPEKSKELLTEAGLPDGFKTTLALPPPSYARRGGEIVAAQLREVGIETEITNVEWAQWLETVFRGRDYGLTIVSHTEPMDIGIYARDDYYFNYDDPVMRTMLEGLDKTVEDGERIKILQAMQERVAENFVNGFLFQWAKTGVANARLHGLWENAPVAANDMSAVYWE